MSPVADFEIVEVPQELISWGNATDLHDLGGGFMAWQQFIS